MTFSTGNAIQITKTKGKGSKNIYSSAATASGNFTALQKAILTVHYSPPRQTTQETAKWGYFEHVCNHVYAYLPLDTRTLTHKCSMR